MEEKKRTNPFWNHLQIEELSSGNGKAEVRSNIFPDLFNLSGNVHGGLLATLIDASIGSAVRSTLESTQRSATVELKINYIKPAKGTALIAKASLSHKGGTLVVGTSEIFDESGNLVAIGTATFIKLKNENGTNNLERNR